MKKQKSAVEKIELLSRIRKAVAESRMNPPALSRLSGMSAQQIRSMLTKDYALHNSSIVALAAALGYTADFARPVSSVVDGVAPAKCKEAGADYVVSAGKPMVPTVSTCISEIARQLGISEDLLRRAIFDLANKGRQEG